MELKKLNHYVKRTYQLGPLASFSLVHTRIKNSFFHKHWRLKARNKTANHSWELDIKRQCKAPFDDFNQFWMHQKTRLDFSVVDLRLTIAMKTLLCDADDYVHNYFSILGSQKKQYAKIPWHNDIRLQDMNDLADSAFDSSLYYKDFEILPGDKEFVKDIKVPWELSRLQYFFALGYAYQQTNNEIYAKTFVSHFEDWLVHNSFLLGANWACPMDVGIRAVNLVWALSLFKTSKSLSNEFLEKITASLYDHLFYLENNWEMYDDLRSSNHYLSDLIGYFYVCYYFYDLPGISQKTTWCFTELLKEFEKQIFDEGSDYEGSTAYHGLITEIFYHYYTLSIKMGFVFEDKFLDKFAGMFSFIDWCKPSQNSSMVSIGDNDSGKLLYYGLSAELVKILKKPHHGESVHFKQFGLSIVKTKDIHYSLRHHVYNDRQPTGHFHNDFASITLALHGIDIFIDPGSYVYTPSAHWRNQFRSVQAHSTFYIKNSEPLDFGKLLFDHAIPEATFIEAWIDDSSPMTLQTSHALYKEKYRLTAYRTVKYNQNNKSIHISDVWKTQDSKDSHLFGCWNFMLSPFITCKKIDDRYLFEYQGKQVAMFQSSICFNLKDTVVSLEYGSKVASQRLEALVNIMHDDPVVTVVTLL